MKFEKYQHVERLGTPATDGILDGLCYIFPKLDGTNTSVYLNDEGQVEVASRNRVLSIHDDNYGVCNYIFQNHERYEKYFTLHPNHRLFGEWLVPHTIHTYIPEAWRKLFIFDVMDCNKYLPWEHYKTDLERCDILTVPPLAIYGVPTQDKLDDCVERNDYLMQKRQIGEGIVIKRYDFVNRFGNTVWAKIVRPHVKAAQKDKKPLKADCIETQIVDKFLTPEFIQKEFDKIAADGWSNKLIGKFLSVTWYTFINEETFNFTRKFHNPKVDFGLLNRLVVEKIKAVKADLF